MPQLLQLAQQLLTCPILQRWSIFKAYSGTDWRHTHGTIFDVGHMSLHVEHLSEATRSEQGGVEYNLIVDGQCRTRGLQRSKKAFIVGPNRPFVIAPEPTVVLLRLRMPPVQN